jgi:hypothetical protein
MSGLNHTRIFYRPHAARQRENAFFEKIRSEHRGAEIIHENYRVSAESLSLLVSRQGLIEQLKRDIHLPGRRKELALDVLRAISSDEIKVACNANLISFDLVVEVDGQPHYFEFHEAQHRNLTDNRLKMIYSPAGEVYRVPRFVQRLVRDVWRATHFRPFTIVWLNSFEQHPDCEIGLAQRVREFKIENQFGLLHLLG